MTKDDVPNLIFTSPFLKEMLGVFLGLKSRKGKIDFDELGLADVTDLLQSPDTHMEAILRDFGNRTQREDPVIHFYELFLTAYDKAKKVQRGVFYTRSPSYPTSSAAVHKLLQTEFGLADGLADTTTWGEMVKKNPKLKLPPLTDEPGEKRTIDPKEPFVQILDPATGTGTFLVEVIDVIHKTLTAMWEKQGKSKADVLKLWNEYVPKDLLPRLYGYELMMAPYAIAHMKIGLKLSETGYRFTIEERARIYLTNSLEPKVTQLPHIAVEALAHEAAAVNEVKWYKRFTVVIGNPPYAGHSSNTGDWITGLVNDYYVVDGKPLGERNPKWLQDDYVKFIRLGQHLIEQSGYGIQSYITNHGYIDNPTFRGMRQQLMASFSTIDLLDLHGNTTKKEVCPDGTEDVNVFDIKQGVAIFAARCHNVKQASSCVVQHAHIYGSRKKKCDQLAVASCSHMPLTPVHPSSPFYLFVPQNSDLKGEYGAFQRMTDAMPVNVLGFQTHRDEVAVAFHADDLYQQVKNYLGHPPQKRDWDRLQSPCTYRLFDVRAVYLHTNICDRPRRELLDHVVHQDNLCLGLGRQGIAVQDIVWSLVTASRFPVDANIFRRGGINIFPLYLYPDTDGLALHLNRRPNFSSIFVDRFAAVVSLPQVSSGEMPRGITPEDILHYAYAVFHSPTYRTRYAEFLKIDFPRLPLTASLDLFRSLSKLGGELVALHLLDSPKLEKPITKWVGGKRPEVEKVSYADGTVWIDKAQTEGFKGVPEDVWNFHIGGYQVCEKWLKDRKGRVLTKDDLLHYQKIVVALRETIRLMAEIDKVIEKHGGWPGAFHTVKENKALK